MSILQAYSVFDKAIGAFARPWYAAARGEAMRLFMDAVNDPASPFHKHPEDFILFQCGEFEDGTGIFSSHDPERVCSALDMLRVPDGPGKGLAVVR